MQYRRLRDGTHVVGVKTEDRFIVCTSAYDAREAKALVKAVNAVFELFFRTSGGFATMVGDKELPRGASAKVSLKKKRKKRDRLKS